MGVRENYSRKLGGRVVGKITVDGGSVAGRFRTDSVSREPVMSLYIILGMTQINSCQRPVDL